MSGYIRRIIDYELDDLLPGVAAISIEGPKAVGKTATASQRANTVYRVDDEADAELLRAAPEQILKARAPILIDEWQRMPAIWDTVRRAVDDGAEPGRYLLTGSAVPTILPLHSGAGRIITLRMRPLSFAERGREQTTISLAQMLRGNADISGTSGLALADYVEEIVTSGFPGIRELPARARHAQLDSYISRVVERDFPEQGQQVRKPETLRAWMSAYAAATATTASYTKILDMATSGLSHKPAKETALSYRDVLSQLWLLDPVSAWRPSSAFAQFGAIPKHFLADPALSARLLGLDEGRLLKGHGDEISLNDKTRLGSLFEALVALSLRSYAQAAEAKVFHLRTSKGDHEVDFIVHGEDGSTVALEVKLDRAVVDKDVKHLVWLRERMGTALTDAAVLYTGPHAYRRPDGIAVIPFSLLDT